MYNMNYISKYQKIQNMNRILNLKPVSIFIFVMFIICLPTCSLNAQETQENVITFDIGSFVITLLSEGQQQGKPDILLGATEDMLRQTAPSGTFPNAVNAFLVKTEDKIILFDTGFGQKLFYNLNSLGFTSNDIDAVVLTHMHGDHIGGLLKDNEKKFPNSELYIPQPEYDYWMNDEEMQKLPENRRSSFINARKVIEAYKKQLNLFVPGEVDKVHELFPGIRSIAAYGHTPGHTGYLLESDLESNDGNIFIWGDIAHAMAVQMPYPQVAVTYDVDSVKAIESRQKILKYLSENKIRVAGMHIQFPAIGDISKNKTEDGYKFVLICECEGR